MKNLDKIRIGTMVEVLAHDHSQHDDAPLREKHNTFALVVRGRLVDRDETFIIIEYGATLTGCKGVGEIINTSFHVILKSAVVGITEYSVKDRTVRGTGDKK